MGIFNFNMVMTWKKYSTIGLSLLCIACSGNIHPHGSEKSKEPVDRNLEIVKNDSGYFAPESYPGYQLVWSDEFDKGRLDTTFWNYDIGNGPSGWGNNELEYYTDRPENIFLSNGKLVIRARKEDYKGFHYTSAKVTTQNKKTFQYGRIDFRAKLPKGQGIWPALWMLGSNISEVGWPISGEIDVMELLGHEPSKVYGTVHYDSASHRYKTLSYTLDRSTFHDAYHVFSLIWQKDTVRILVDDHPELEYHNSEGANHYPFNAPFYLIMNVAVGGNWPGNPDSSTLFPQEMYVDYVRAFEKK